MPARHKLPDQDVLQKLLIYCPATGALTWRARGPEWFQNGKQSAEKGAQWWNVRFAGKPALSTMATAGYRKGNLFFGDVLAHRVIWKLVHGTDPETIDHVNGDRADNRISNLRSVSQRENQKNLSMPRTNTSGAIGVHWCKTTGKWCAQIRPEPGKRITLGFFSSLDDAVAARAEANIRFGFHENHGRPSSATISILREA